MAERFELIERKQAVQRQIEQVRRQLEHECAKRPSAQRTVARLEAQLAQLMADEARLRIAIDQSKR